ncbi:MAG: carbamoyltransferase N-terminal domain-containing protein [Myxococcota bacterium]
MKILGISAYFHDSAAALVVDGKVVAAAQEERFSRRKHDSDLPVQAAAFCLAQAGLSMADVDHVVFHEKPLRKFERILVTGLRDFPATIPQLTRSLTTWLSGRLWLKADICQRLGCAPEQLLFGEHHLSHAASAFLTSPFERAAVITADGVGEWTTTAIHHGVTTPKGCRLEPIKELHFPHSIGLLYSALTAYLGFEVNDGEYKVMGLAPYGRPIFSDELSQLCRISPDASLELDMRYFCFHRHPTRSFTPALEKLLGPAREPGSPLALPAVSSEDQRFADIAASLQQLTERYMLTLAHEAHRITGEENLCMAGGVALNSVANHRVATEGPFRRVFVQPAAGDAGGALGAALWATHVLHGVPRPSETASPLLGAAYAPDDIRRFLADCRVPHQAFSRREELYAEVARRLDAGEVGGFFQGRFEWGPRALGARSILADARDAGMKDRVNRKIKYRESFRPFAPAVLADEAPRYFHLHEGREEALTPFMLTVVPVTDEGRTVLPAVTHVDGTARVQTVRREESEALHDLLHAFRARTGVGVLLNTSMNLKDEPLCASPAEAYGVFARSELDFLVLEDCLVERRPHA